MKRLLLTSLAALLLGSGCIIVTNPNSGSSGNITFSWNFAGASCSQAPQVASVRVTMPGETLQNNGSFPCLVSGFPGVVLNDFAAGTYTFTVDALDASSQVLFTKTGTVTVNGDVTVNVTLDSVAPTQATALMTWSFPATATVANPSCADVGVANVDVSFDGAAAVRFPCAQGQTVSGATTPKLALGNHAVVMTAVTSDNYPLYGKSGTLVVQAAGATANAFQFAWAVGAAKVGWNLTGNVALTCATAGTGITTVYVNFKDVAGTWVYGQNGDPQACTAMAAEYDYLKPGVYSVYVGARDSANHLFEPLDTNNLPTVTVQAGVFTVNPITLNLVKKN